jgi:hypothetical protein
MKIVNLVVNLWQTEKASIQFKYYRGKIKQEKNRYRGFSRESNDELDDILTIAAKMEITNHF